MEVLIFNKEKPSILTVEKANYEGAIHNVGCL